MIRIKEAVIVEGKYDKIKLSDFIDGLIITTEGFGVFKNKEKQALLRRLAATKGLLILTDSDSAGFVIRNFLKGCIPKEQLKHAYIPDIKGKEKRKDKPSKEGKLGVEGMTEAVLAKAIAASGAHCTIDDDKKRHPGDITKTDLFEYGLSGGVNSAAKRASIKEYLELPMNMTANSLLDVLNSLMTKSEFIDMCKKLFIAEDGDTDA